MTEHESTSVEIKNLALFLSVFGLALATVFASLGYFSYRDRLATLESTAIAQVPRQSDANAVVVSKDIGLFSDGYKMTVKTRNQEIEVYLTPEEYLSANVGQKTCVSYRLWNGKVKGAHLCQTPTGGK